MLKEQQSSWLIDKRGHNLTNCLNAWLHNQIAKKEKENKNNVLRTFLMTIKSISKQYVVNRHNPELMHTSVL